MVVSQYLAVKVRYNLWTDRHDSQTVGCDGNLCKYLFFWYFVFICSGVDPTTWASK